MSRRKQQKPKNRKKRKNIEVSRRINENKVLKGIWVYEADCNILPRYYLERKPIKHFSQDIYRSARRNWFVKYFFFSIKNDKIVIDQFTYDEKEKSIFPLFMVRFSRVFVYKYNELKSQGTDIYGSAYAYAIRDDIDIDVFSESVLETLEAEGMHSPEKVTSNNLERTLTHNVGNLYSRLLNISKEKINV